MNKLLEWTNENSGFLSLVLFILTFLYTWISGILKSLIKKPKLRIRFLNKMTFYSFLYTGEKTFNKELDEDFDLHKTGFVIYISIANIGNKPTSIDKIWLGYKKSTLIENMFKRSIQWIPQWNPIESFKIKMANETELVLNNLRLKNDLFDNNETSNLEVGKSLVGTVYFEQLTAWGNLHPKQNKKGVIDVIIKIQDIYGKNFKFKTKLNQLPIEKAREYNPYFANVEKLMHK